jgi:leucyl aminopeptidase
VRAHTPAEFSSATTAATDAAADVLFVPTFGDSDTWTDLPWLEAATGGEVTRARARGEFGARPFDTFATVIAAGAARATRIVMIAAGPAADSTPERIRRIGAACGYTARKIGAESYAILVRGRWEPAVAAQHLTDGATSAEFVDGSYKQPPTSPATVPARVVIIAPGADAAVIDAAVRRGHVIGRSANWTRAAANEPSNVLTTTEFASRISNAAAVAGLSVDVFDETRISEMGMRLLLGVAQASTSPPRMVVIRHQPPGAAADGVHLGFIGKGVTFDTGGVSIKPADGMERMKSDMSGAAAVAGAMQAIAALKGANRVTAVIPIAENMVGGKAIRPGDVIRGASGTTVEVINTDAEGRLILADALWYARQQGCTHLVDVATLTGAITIALGRHVAGVMGQPETFVEAVRQAGMRGGERLWPLPIYEEAREQLRSEIADLSNVGGRPGGSITAAAFLRAFAGDGPWAHLDIAGTAWAESKEPYQPKGATGVAVRTLIEVATAAWETRP